MSAIEVEVTVSQAQPVNITAVSEEITVEQNQIAIVQSTNHSLLSHLGYAESGHTGFQKELDYDDWYKCYLIEH